MRSLAADPCQDELRAFEDGARGASPAGGAERRNFVMMVLYQVLMRTGWIFKTESIIMPTVVDTLSGAAWLRGCLPMLNRLAQSLTPLLAARSIKVLRRKKFAVFACTLVMAAAFLTLSLAWLAGGGAAAGWMPPLFLLLYTLFFMGNGVNQMSVSTLQGKLIRARRRGRLLLVSNNAGAATAIAFALGLLPLWLRPEGARFAPLFAFAGGCFGLAALASLLLVEPPDHYREPAAGVGRVFREAWAMVRRDAEFRRLAVVSMLFTASLTLFPHYQALGRGGALRLDLSHLMWWVVVQNAGTALFSLLAGPLADWRGNRLVLRAVMLGLCGAPLTALALAHLGPSGRALFPFVFLLVGLTPIGIKTFHNYTLEIVGPEEHPRYLSTLSVCSAVPLLASPLVGLVVDLVGFDAAFIGITLAVLAGALLTFRLSEPRRRVPSAETPPLADEA